MILSFLGPGSSILDPVLDPRRIVVVVSAPDAFVVIGVGLVVLVAPSFPLLSVSWLLETFDP